MMTLWDPNGKPWAVTFVKNENHGALSAGWCGFSYANNLEKYDICVFELIKRNHMKVHIFGEDASPKVKKFMKVLMNKLQKGQTGEGGGFMNMVGSRAQEFLKHKLEESDEDYVKPAMKTEVCSTQEVYAGANKRGLPDNGILISGCQTDQTSADANSSNGAYGALSNAIQTILAESHGEISNQELVLRARKVLAKQGFTQRPGPYCSDDHVGASFVC